MSNGAAGNFAVSRMASDKVLVWILRLGTAACFLGWAWQHLYWEGPYTAILWNPRVFNLLEGLGLDWDTIVGRGGGRLTLQFSRVVGWILALCGLISFTLRRGSWVQSTILLLGSACLVLASAGAYLSARQGGDLFFEHGGQFLIPLLLVLSLEVGSHHRLTRWVAAVAILMTFGGHGVYAVGLSATPGHFIGMLRVLLSVPEEWAVGLLRLAGFLDFAVCVALFIPVIRGPALIYAGIWGTLTAMARPVAGMDSALVYWGADQYLHEALYRIPHGAIPLFLYLAFRETTRTAVASDAELETVPDSSHNPDPGKIASRNQQRQA